MQNSGRQREKHASFGVRVFSAFVITAVGAGLLPAHASVVGEKTREAPSGSIGWFRNGVNSDPRKQPGPEPQSARTPDQRAMDVQYIRLCPRKILLYEEEAFTLVPAPLNSSKETVHGAAMTWGNSDQRVATVSCCGEVSAKGPGQCIITVQIGTQHASVAVVVEGGLRPRISDQEWDSLHVHDCDYPEAAELNDRDIQRPHRLDLVVTKQELAQGVVPERTTEKDGVDGVPEAYYARATMLKTEATRLSHASPSALGSRRALPVPVDILKPLLRRAASAVIASRPPSTARLKASRAIARSTSLGSLFQGELPDGYFSQATTIDNAIGTPRHSPVELTSVNSIKTKNNLGSSNYGFVAPALGLSGRGIDVALILSYNAQLWGKETSGTPTKMVFDFNKLGPAPGWSAGFGRLIPNYDNTLTGDGSSIGSLNAPGNYLLIAPNGTRIQLTQQYDSVTQKWNHTSADGLFTTFNPRSQNLKYSDGMFVTYFSVNNRLLPIKIRNTNGDQINIGYRAYNSTSFPNRFAINQIADSLGRIVQFYYYGDPQYPTGPLAKLAAITAPDQGSGTRTMIRVEYQTITLLYDFQSSYLIDGPASNTPLSVVSRVYYPATGRGYLFLDYSSYGMCRYISERKDMTGPSGVVDGNEIAYTKYNFVDIGTQVDHLNDAPQYTERREWWQGKIDGPTASLYTYQRTKNGSTDTATVTEPLTNLQIVTTSSGGQVSSIEHKNGTTVLNRVDYFYLDFSNPTRLTTINTTNEAGNTASVTYEYGSYNRVTNIYESGFSGSTIRRTRYQYSDVQGYIDLNMLRLVTQVAVFDGPTGSMKQKTNFTYDDYAIKGGMESYGLTPSTYPPNHDSSFDQNYATRGNVTGVQTFSSISQSISTTRYSKYDVFGHLIEADVSCCQVKTATFGWNTFFSQPDATTDGKSGVVPYLTISYQYDFNTGLVAQSTDPNGQTAYFSYDSAWRPLTMTTPSGALTTTKLDKDDNQNDQLAYSQQLTYSDNGVSKTITTKIWFDGAGRAIRTGTGAGTSPSSFDTIVTQYDSIGRVLKQSNPYSGDSSGNGSPSYWTTNVYDDPLSRVKEIDLPDDQPLGQRSRILTSYNGPVVTVTDQVGRTRQSVMDALGRPISVTEQDPATGALSLTTGYVYDVLNNTTQVSQGSQIRTFAYDALSRMTSQTTPEAGQVSFTYTDFGAVQKGTDSRNVETHFKYDSLNRGIQIWYTGLGGDDAGTNRPALPSGVAATADVVLGYNTAAPGNGEVSTTTDGAGTQIYSYDGLGRTTSKTRTIDGNSYQTQYEYNQANQGSLMIYPSGKRVRINRDSKGRFLGEDKVDVAGSVLTSYVSSTGYNVAGQVTGLNLGNGVNETYSYSSNRLQLTAQTATKGTALTSLNYNYQASAGASGVGTSAGNSGQLMSIAAGSIVNGQARNETYSYDDLGRLASAAGYYAQRNYSYDRWGNRTGVSGGSSQIVILQQPGGVTNNRIASVNSVSYSYDATGNLTSDGVHSYQYDAVGRITGVDGTAATYSYDAENRRVKKVAGGYTTYYIWEGGSVVAEYSNAPAGSGVKYYLADRLSTRVVTDSGGSVIGTQDHLPFGEDSGTSTGQTEKHRFTNYERDSESGTDYAVNRQYAMSTGRFTRPDPAGGSLGDPQALNQYAYALNDPINLSDPLGLYEACVHKAMSKFIGRRAGLSKKLSRQLGNFAGDGPGGADSKPFAASPLNSGTWPIHFPTEEQLAGFKSTFWDSLNSGTPRGIQRASHTVHAIEDGRGAHRDYIDNVLGVRIGHATPNFLQDYLPYIAGVSIGISPDRVIGDRPFVDASNEVLQLLTRDPDARLTDQQVNDLIDAILKECGNKFEFKIIRPILPQIGPQIGAISPGDGAGYPSFGSFRWFWSPPERMIIADPPEICWECL